MTIDRSESAPSVQEEIFRTLLATPHRLVDETLAIHKEQLDRDPYMYGKLATHAVHHGNCSVRDVQDSFVATLFVSPYPEHREAAWVMLQSFPPFRVVRVLNYIRGYTEIVTHRSTDKPMPTAGQFGVSISRAHYSPNHGDLAKRSRVIPSVTKGMGKKIRKHLKSKDRDLTIDVWRVRHACYDRPLSRISMNAVKNYLRFREREDNRSMMEGAIIRAGNLLKKLYSSCHLLPGESEDSWINRILFHGEAPEGSRVEAMQKLISEEDPTVQAEIVVDAKLPYPVVRSLFKAVTPSVQVASIMIMTPQELLANLATLKRDGAFDNPEIKELIQTKLEATKKVHKGKIDALKGEATLAAVADLDEDTKAIIQDVTDAQIKQHGTIGAKTALLIDKSKSMTGAIEAGKTLGSAIAQACAEGSFQGCYLFGTHGVRMDWMTADGDITKKSAWDKKLAMIKADGRTDLGAAGRLLLRLDALEQIVIITDEGENGSTELHQLMPEFKAKFGAIPNIVIVRISGTRWGSSARVTNSCRAAGAEVDVLEVKSHDKISVPNVINMLSGRSMFDNIQDILGLSLPTREAWYKKNWAEKLEQVQVSA